MIPLSSLGLFLLLIYIIRRLVIFVKIWLSNTNKLPCFVTPIQPISALGAMFPRSPIHYGISIGWDRKSDLYKKSPLKTLLIQPVLYGKSTIFSSNLELFRQVFSFNCPYEKPEMSIVRVLGENVVSADGDIWKRHRRITAPAFNHTTYRNVWETTARVYEEMIKEEGWSYSDETPVVNFNKITHKLALFLISIVGFGLPMSWSAPPYDAQGRRSIQSLIFSVSANVLLRSQLPRWLYALGIKRVNEIEEVYSEFENLMHERIEEREKELTKARSLEGYDKEKLEESIGDVFGRLVNSRLSEGKFSLSDDEIIGNCFIFTFAGHETTANTLALTLAELASNSEAQDWVYNSIYEKIGNRVPTFEDYDSLDCVLACFFEGLRMYPAAFLATRVASIDNVVKLNYPEGISDLVIKKGEAIVVDLIGVGYDPVTFPEPHIFNPQRWLSDYQSEKESSITRETQAGEVSGTSPASTLNGFVNFLIGPRTCLGHKFAKVESVSFLTHLLRDWKIVPELRNGETQVEWRKRVLSQPNLGLTLAVDDVPLKLIKRTRVTRDT